MNLIREAWIDEQKCKDGLQALRHEKSEKDKKGNWRETHEDDSAAAFRYMAMYLNDTPAKRVITEDPFKKSHNHVSGWMGQ